MKIHSVLSCESESKQEICIAVTWRSLLLSQVIRSSSLNVCFSPFCFYFWSSDKKPTASDIFVYTVNKHENRLKVIKLSVAELWSQNYKIRINNINDKNKKANADKEIKSQINYAMKHKVAFHNSLHFVGESFSANSLIFIFSRQIFRSDPDFCRYGEQVELRKRQVSESVKWGTVGLNAGIFMLQREKSHSFSK